MGRRTRKAWPLRECVVRDGPLDRFDGDWLVANIEHARRFAWGGAHASGHLRKVVGREQAPDCLVEAAPVHQVVPLGDQIAERTTLMAKRNAAIHAARCLGAHLLVGRRLDDFAPILNAILDRSLVLLDPTYLQEAFGISHGHLRLSPPPAVVAPPKRGAIRAA